ncbi:MAG: 2-hydroxyacyl-CoA dehydratase family protein [Deltaproteobacteria bacterium]|jgi:benzoyl-CoA reductase/2-hydroxyglutaryl-CoA dehydratase subunit BcrC/BadD/HgdB|nr:2-hydroxyacyl-CoA dehydratase family protein [Deltaproteobacteria bacterium]
MSENDRLERLRRKVAEKRDQETKAEIARLRARTDWRAEFEPFLQLLELGPKEALKALRQPVIATMCVTVPRELAEAHGFHLYRLQSGHMAVESLVAPNLPAVMCPMTRSALGAMVLDGLAETLTGAVWPTMCDWVVKMGSSLSLCGVNVLEIHRLEVPRIKTCLESRERWQSEIRRLNDFFKRLGQGKLDRAKLAQTILSHQKAYATFSALMDLKRRGLLGPAWLSVLAQAFFLEPVNKWTKDAANLVAALQKETPPAKARPKIFLAGSPIFFPNFKMYRLFDEVGLEVVADDLCSGERFLPGPVHFADSSLHGLMMALAQRYFIGCLCPIFADNELRINNITAPERLKLYQGVVFHVLKGCHCYDLESLALEAQIKKAGLKYLRLETDHSPEDWSTLATRLEAFRSSLAADL